MPTITRLVHGKRNPNRVNIYLDDHFALALSVDVVVSRSLKLGRQLTEGEVIELKAADDQSKLYAKILNFISYRPRSIQEVRHRLRSYGVTEPDAQNQLVARLQTQGYLDDLAFARWLVESRARSRPRSARHLSAELASKGISPEIIAAVIPPETDLTALPTIIRKKSSSLDHFHLVAYLARRGFRYADIQRELDEMGISG